MVGWFFVLSEESVLKKKGKKRGTAVAMEGPPHIHTYLHMRTLYYIVVLYRSRLRRALTVSAAAPRAASHDGIERNRLQLTGRKLFLNVRVYASAAAAVLVAGCCIGR